ncbi:MAG: BON domain-containing protein [Bryobacteraceae bacterium]
MNKPGLAFCLMLLLPVAPVWAEKQPVTDDRIYDQVLLKLASDPEVGGREIKVEVHNGRVIIKGKVQRDKQKSKAEHLVKKVKGVTGVDNQLIVGER